MTPPLLHTRIRKSLNIEQAPEQVIRQLDALTNDNFRMIVDESDSDNLQFKMQRGLPPDIIISGFVRRWHGTDSRLDFVAEVNVPPANTRIQQLLALVVTLTMMFVYGRILLSWSDSPVFLWNTTAILGILTILTGWASYWLLVRDTNSKKRWRVQQEIAQFVTRIEALATIQPDTSNLEDEQSISDLLKSESNQTSNAQSTT
mgnify:CR=1 FL=1